MELTKQVISLEISKKLTELGFEGKYLFVWYRGGVHMKKIPGMRLLPKYMCGYIPAYTASELMEYLPEEIQLPYKDKKGESSAVLEIHKQKGKYYPSYVTRVQDMGLLFEIDNLHILSGDTLADALGQMLIYLLSNNLIDGNN